MPELPSQLALPLPHTPEYGRESFIPGPSNAAALQLVERWPDWPAPVVVLCGPPGSGKTHLAHIWAERSRAAIASATGLAGLTSQPNPGCLVIEDVASAGLAEKALFHLMNSMRESGASLLVTARQPAVEWHVALPDLRSRLRLAAPLALAAPDEELLRKVLVKLFADRQLIVEKAVIDYLLVRMERSLSAAVRVVDLLDREGLAASRKITRPLAARILAEITGEPEAFTETK